MPKTKRYKTLRDVFTNEELEFYSTHPKAFIEDVIFRRDAKINGGNLCLTPQQEEIAESILNNDWTSVAAGRGIGKTAFLAWLIIWWMCIYATPKVVAIAPSFPQLQSVLWPEINKWLKRSAVNECFKWGKKRIYLRVDPSNSFAEPRTASKEEAMQGLHEDNLLVIIDEASGVDDKIWDVVQGSLTNENNKVCLMSNPTRITGFFYDSHHGEKELWSTHMFSSEDSPVVDRKYIERMKFKYVHGTQIHDMYKMHVLGQFPSGDPDAFFTLDDVMTMIGTIDVSPAGMVELGVDVARKGDDETVIAIRQGGYFFSAQELGLFVGGEPTLYTAGKTTIPETTEMVIKAVKAVRAKTGYQGITKVKVDDTGVGGGVTDELDLLATMYSLEVVPCNFGGSGADYEWDANEATHMWANLADNINKVRLPFDKALMEELVSRRWFPNENGKRKLESKKDFKKTFKASPDRADAVVLCMADANRAKLVASSFNHSINFLKTAPALDIMGKGNVTVGLYSSPKGNLSLVGISQHMGEVGIFMHKEGSVYELTEMIRALNSGATTVGSQSMFGEGIPVGIEFMKMGIPIINAYSYNETRSVLMLDTLMNDKKLTIARECDLLINQLTSWKQKSTKSDMVETHGGCYALLTGLSMIDVGNQCAALTGTSF